MPLPDDNPVSGWLKDWTLVVPVANENVLRTTLLRSPAVNSGCELLLERSFTSAGKAYNAGIDASKNELLVFAHQDVYLPPRWMDELSVALRQLHSADPNWGVVGVWGRAASGTGEGFVHSTGLARTLGQPFDRAVEVQTLDELLLITRRSSGLRFDEALPGFHLYGTDLCLQARAMGRKNYVISTFCVHNSTGLRALPLAFWTSYEYLRRKWCPILPIITPCTIIRKSYLGMLTEACRSYKGALARRCKIAGGRAEDPAALYRTLVSQ